MQQFFADLHIHSKYSRACSPDMDPEHLYAGAREKGLDILGTGDFTHPKWLAELKKKLVPSEYNGLFHLKGKPELLFMLTAEVSTFFSTPQAVRKVHHIIHAPSFEVVDQLNDVYGKLGSLSSDGRPMFGNCSPAKLAELTFEVSKELVIVPAHAWTPHFGVFGSMSGYDSLDEAYEEQSKNIFAIETGMSSDPAMNWRISGLDNISLVSNSDSHSPHPWRIGRECNVFSFPEKRLSYENIFRAVREKDAKNFLFTVEVDPSYGKYHFDGHRNCKFSCSPEESKKIKGICPVCRRPLTIGVLNRVEELADRPEGFVPKGAIPFKSLLPLHELIGSAMSAQMFSKKVGLEYTKLISAFGSEFNILINVPFDQLSAHTHEKIAWAVMLNREAKIKVVPGYDGEYGRMVLSEDIKNSPAKGQKFLADFL